MQNMFYVRSICLCWEDVIESGELLPRQVFRGLVALKARPIFAQSLIT